MHRPETAPHSTLHSKLYATLGVSPGASTEAIRRAYRVLEDAYRPGGAYVDDVMHLAFTEISRAASILGAPKTRKLYDQGYIDEFGKPTKAGLARKSRVRTAIFSSSALFAIGLAGLAVFAVESQNRESGPMESATDAASVQRASELSPPPTADQTLKSVSNDKPALQGSDGAAPLQAGARDPAIQAAQAKPRERRTPNPERRRVARLSKPGPGIVQSYIWFGAPAPVSRPIRAAQTLKTAHCLACLTDHRADCSRTCP
jgi:curved DNA-binding protein CbpA